MNKYLILCIIIDCICCTRSSRTVLNYFALDNTYEIEFSTNRFDFLIDSSSYVHGNPEGVDFYCKDFSLILQVFIGNTNPPGWYKHTFDFSESTHSLEQDIRKTLIYNFIGIDTMFVGDQMIKIVHYVEYDQLEVVETQFETIDNLIVNLHIALPVNFKKSLNIRSLLIEVLNSFAVKRCKSD